MDQYTSNQIQEIAAGFRDKKIIVFPTDTVYGIGALFGDPVLLDKLKKSKQRPERKALPVMVHSIEQIQSMAWVSDSARKVIERYLPGPLTIILKTKPTIDPVFTNGLDTIAIRIPDHPDLLRILKEVNAPIFASSANLSGQPEAKDARQARELALNYDILVEGNCLHQQASTILDLSTGTPVILREGPISIKEIEETILGID